MKKQTQWSENPFINADSGSSVTSRIDNSRITNQLIWPLVMLGVISGIALALSISCTLYQKSQTEKLYTEYRMLEYYVSNQDATLIAMGLKSKDDSYKSWLKQHLKEEHN